MDAETIYSAPQNYMNVSGQFHVPSAIPHPPHQKSSGSISWHQLSI